MTSPARLKIMTEVVTNFGQEFLLRAANNDIDVTQVTCLLYDDSVDDITVTNDLGDITSELTASSYSRQTTQIPTELSFQPDSGAASVEFDGVSFDLTTQSGESFNAVGVIVNFQSTIFASDGSPTDHLISTHVLNMSYQIDDYTGTSTINNFGINLV